MNSISLTFSEIKVRKLDPIPVDAPWLPDHTGRLSPVAAFLPLADRLRYLIEPGQTVEIRALNIQHVKTNGKKSTHTEAGFYAAGSVNRMALDVLNMSRKASGVYFTLNPVDPGLYARSPGKMNWAKSGTLTTDSDIIRRRWLLIDCDPVRPADTSSTDAEKAAALATAERVRHDLRGRGWTEPILSDSGNGYHLLYRIDLPVEDAGMVARVLEAIANLHDGALVKIDTVVHNAARICKLPGTWSKKGPNTAERPWRLAQMLEIPVGDVLPVPIKLLEEMAAMAPAPASHTGIANGSAFAASNYGHAPHAPAARPDGGYTSRLLMGEWLRDSGRSFIVKHKPDGSTWFEIDCPFHPDHTADFVQRPDGQNGFHCFHARCKGRSYQDAKAVIGPQNGMVHYSPPLVPAKPWDDPEFDFNLTAESIATLWGVPEYSVPIVTAIATTMATLSPAQLSPTAERVLEMAAKESADQVEADIERSQLIQEWLDDAGIGNEFDPNLDRTCGYGRHLCKEDKRLRVNVCCHQWRGCDFCRQRNRHVHAKHWAGWFLILNQPLYRVELPVAKRRFQGDYIRITQEVPASSEFLPSHQTSVVYSTSPNNGGGVLMTPLEAAEQVMRDFVFGQSVIADGKRINAVSKSDSWPECPKGNSDDRDKGYVIDKDATALSAAGVSERMIVDALRVCRIAVWTAPKGISRTSDSAISYHLDGVRHKRLIDWLCFAASEGCRVQDLAGWDPTLKHGPYENAQNSYWSLEINTHKEFCADHDHAAMASGTMAV